LEKINELCNNLDSLTPLLIDNEPNLTIKIRSFFQELFNDIVRN